MHIEPVTQTFTVTLNRKEMRAIAYGLTLHAANAGTKPDMVATCVSMAEKLTNAMKLTIPPTAKNKA